MSKKSTLAPTVNQSNKAIVVEWPNGVLLRFALQDGAVLGIRDVRCDGVLLRNPTKLWKPLITTPDGIHYSRFEFKKALRTANGSIVVRTEAVGSSIALREEQDEYLGDVFNLALPDGSCRDMLEWELKPSRLSIEGRIFTGFALRYRFTSKQGRKIYRVFDDASWEIGGHVDGNTLLLQGQVNPPATALKIDGFFTTACNYYGAEMRGIMGRPTRVSFQRLPRIGTLQAFDFLVHQAGALLGRFEPLTEVLSVVQKDAGEDVLHVLDELRRPMAPTYCSPWKHILFHPAGKPWAREDQRNLWMRVFDFVHGAARRRCGARRSAVLPRVWIPQYYRDTFAFGDKTHPRDKMLYVLADEALPVWADMGVREICTHSLWHSDYTEDRFKRKDEVGGMHGALIVGSICSVREHSIAPLWGGPEALAYFVEKAHGRGMQVQLWWASHLSRRAPILAERPDFMLMARDGLPNGGGYGHTSIVTVDLNNRDCFDWIFNHLKALHDRTGFDGLFHDSYGNMTFLPMNYADPLRRGQQAAYERLLKALQQAGIRSFTIEGLGPYGVGHFGMGFAKPAARSGRRWQNALEWWIGQEDMLCGLNMGIGVRPWAGDDPNAMQFGFRCLAAGGRFGFSEHQGSIEAWSGWLRDQNRMFARVAPLHGRRTLLPQDRGVLWEQPDGQRILFAFRAFEHAAGRLCAVFAVAGDGERNVAERTGSFPAVPWKVYRMV